MRTAIEVYNAWTRLVEPKQNTPLKDRDAKVISSAINLAEALHLYGLGDASYIKVYMESCYARLSSSDCRPPYYISQFGINSNKSALGTSTNRRDADREMAAILAAEQSVPPIQTLINDLAYAEGVISSNVDERGFGPKTAAFLLLDMCAIQPYIAVLLCPTDPRILHRFGASALGIVKSIPYILGAVAELPKYRLYNDIDIQAFTHFMTTGNILTRQ